jgi:hypothetical protein
MLFTAPDGSEQQFNFNLDSALADTQTYAQEIMMAPYCGGQDVHISISPEHIHEERDSNVLCLEVVGGYSCGEYGIVDQPPSQSFPTGIESLETRYFSITPLPCLPSQIGSGTIYAHMCDGRPCIDINWEATPPYVENRRTYQLDEIWINKQTKYAERTVVNLIRLAPDQNTYRDFDIESGVQYVYTLRYVFDELFIGGRNLFITTPSELPWDCFLDGRGSPRCDDYE